MTLLFVDGFDSYATADLPKKYNNVGAAATIRTGTGRRGGNCFGSGNSSSTTNLTKIFPATTSWVIGFSLKLGAYPSNTTSIAALLDAGTTQCSLRINTDGTLSVVRGTSTAVTDGTSSWAISGGAEAYVEWKVTIADSIGAGSCKVRVNGLDVITVATGQDLKSTANATANQLTIGTNATTGTTMDMDDLYVCNTSGSTNNDFLGDCRIDTIYPTSDGNYSQFTPSTGSSHFALVDEATPNTTDYNDGAAVNDRDSYGMGNLSALASQTVYGIQVNAAVLKDDAGSKSVATFVRSGSTDGDGVSTALGTSQVYVSQVFEADPNGSIAWTESSVNALEAGVKVTA